MPPLESFKQHAQWVLLVAKNCGRAAKLLLQNAARLSVHCPPEVVAQLKGVFDADQVSVSAHPLRPALLCLGHKGASSDRDDRIAVVVPPCPVLKEIPDQICQRLPVLSATLLHRRNLVELS